MSKVISDLPFQLIIPNLCPFTFYYMTGQYNEDLWRVYYFALIFVLISLNSSSLGLTISAWLVDYPTAAAFIGCCSLFPMLLFTGSSKLNILKIKNEKLFFQVSYFCCSINRFFNKNQKYARIPSMAFLY